MPIKLPAKPLALLALLCWTVLAPGQPALGQDTTSAAATRAASTVTTTPIVYKPFRRGISQTVQLPPSLQDLRRRLIAGQALRTADLRALADAGDSLAQMRFAKLLSGMTDPTLDRARVHYYAMAAYNGREGAVRPLLALLRAHGATLDAAALDNAEAALVAQADHGQVDAVTGLARFYLAGTPFGLKAIEGQEMMAKVAEAGDYQTALDLALQLIGDGKDAGAMAQARQYLAIAAESPEPALRATALSLLDSSSNI